MKIVTKVDIEVSEDGGECDPNCVFFGENRETCTSHCLAFDIPINQYLQRCIPCQAREDVNYQMPVVEE